MKFFKRIKFLIFVFSTLIFWGLYFNISAKLNSVSIINSPENIQKYITHEISKYDLVARADNRCFESLNYLLVSMDASNWKSSDDFYLETGKVFKFDSSWFNDQKLRTYDLWLDFMHGLPNIPQRKIVVIIKNLSSLNTSVGEALPYKIDSNDIIRAFSKFILPFFEKDNELFGKLIKSKKFNVYYS